MCRQCDSMGNAGSSCNRVWVVLNAHGGWEGLPKCGLMWQMPANWSVQRGFPILDSPSVHGVFHCAVTSAGIFKSVHSQWFSTKKIAMTKKPDLEQETTQQWRKLMWAVLDQFGADFKNSGHKTGLCQVKWMKWQSARQLDVWQSWNQCLVCENDTICVKTKQCNCAAPKNG